VSTKSSIDKAVPGGAYKRSVTYQEGGILVTKRILRAPGAPPISGALRHGTDLSLIQRLGPSLARQVGALWHSAGSACPATPSFIEDAADRRVGRPRLDGFDHVERSILRAPARSAQYTPGSGVTENR